MGDATTERRSPEREPTRRAVLAGGAATLGAVVGAAGAASGQVTTTGVITVPDQWADRNLAGFTVLVSESDGGSADETAEPVSGDATETDPVETTAAATDTATPDCDYGDWPPDEVAAYDASLIDRKDEDAPRADVTLHVGADVDVPANVLYLVNTFERCESEHVGVELELLDEGTPGGEFEPNVEIEDDERPNAQTEDGTTGVTTPGFGAVGALAALAGVAGYLARRGGE